MALPFEKEVGIRLRNKCTFKEKKIFFMNPRSGMKDPERFIVVTKDGVKVAKSFAENIIRFNSHIIDYVPHTEIDEIVKQGDSLLTKRMKSKPKPEEKKQKILRVN